MTLANKLTSLRIVLSPVFFVIFWLAMLIQGAEIYLIILLCFVFTVIELSDFFDGMAARARGEESELGKVLDPFADSVSRLSYFICFTMAGFLQFWILIIIIYRDLFTAFIRMYFATKGIAAGSRFTGKVKAWVYAAAGIAGLVYFSIKKLLIFPEIHDIVLQISNIIFLLCVLIALITVADYSSSFWKKKKSKKLLRKY